MRLTAQRLTAYPLTAISLTAVRAGEAIAGFNPVSLSPAAFFDFSRQSTLFQDDLGTTPVTGFGQDVGLALDMSQGTTHLNGAWKGLDGEFDFYINKATGSDSNNGRSPDAAWATLKLIQNIALSSGQTVRVRVASGTYDSADDAFSIDYSSITNAKIEIAFEPNCVMDGTVHGTSAVNPIYVGPINDGEFTVEIFGNGLTIQNYNGTTGGTPNGLGYGQKATIIARDVTVDNCIDGISGHQDGIGYFYDCTVLDQSKSLIANVQDSQGYFYRCRVEGADGTNDWLQTRFGRNEFYDCVFIPGVGGQLVVENTLFKRCQIGTLAASTDITVFLSGANFNTVVFEDCFLNVDIRMKQAYVFRRCFGKFSGEIAANDGPAGTFVMENCVFSGAATGATEIFYSNGDDGSTIPLRIDNNIFAGTDTLMAVDATNAGYIVSSGSTFRNNVLTDSKVYDADLVTADTGNSVIQGTITAAPNIGTADSLLMADYAFSLPSFASTAGFGGGDVGYSESLVSERVPQEVRGLSQFPGNHLKQTVAASRGKWARIPAGQVRRNLLESTADFSDPAWAAVGGAAIDADGNVTGVTNSAGQNVRQIYKVGESVEGETYIAAIDVRGSGENIGKNVSLFVLNDAVAPFDVAGVTVTLTADWQRITTDSITGVAGNTGVRFQFRGADTNNATAFQIRRPQLEMGSTVTNYQRINSEYDITESGVPSKVGIRLDGANDSMVTAAIDLTGTDAATLAAAYINVGGGTGRLLAHKESSPGRLELTSAGNGRVQGAGGGTIDRFATSANNTVPANAPAYAVSRSDISNDDITVSGTAAVIQGGDQGTGNYANSELRLGDNSLGSSPFDGYLFAAFLAPRYITGEETADLESWLASKAGA